jgi:transposase
MNKTQTAYHFKVSLNSVKGYVKQWETEKTLRAKPIPGRPRVLIAANLAVIEAKRSDKPDTTLAEHVEHLQQTTGLLVSTSTICRLFQRQKVTRKKKSKSQRAG